MNEDIKLLKEGIKNNVLTKNQIKLIRNRIIINYIRNNTEYSEKFSYIIKKDMEIFINNFIKKNSLPNITMIELTNLMINNGYFYRHAYIPIPLGQTKTHWAYLRFINGDSK